MKRKTIAGLSVAALAVLAAGAFVTSGPSNAADDKAAAGAKPALTVSVTQPGSADLPRKLAANGSIAAWQEAIIGSEVNGLRLAELRANVGDTVAAGQVLAVFAAEQPAAELAAARAALGEAEVAAQAASADAARAKSLQGSGALSAQQIQQYLTAEAGANARLESAKANLVAAQLRMKHTQVLAPDAGVITARSATVGSVPGAGTELFRMIRQGRLEWRAEVTPEELGLLKRGQAATLTAVNGTAVRGTVRAIAPSVDTQTRTALVYVDLADAGDKAAPVKAGMFAKGEFDLGASKGMTLPQQAVVVRDGFNYVFRVNKDQRVTQVKVRTGRRVGDRVEILEGLAADAQVVTAGAGFLADGDLVKVAAANGNTASPAAPAAAKAK